ncbi:hypothetical protein SmJEL517_g03042, partial [Synchytrium microbalum]
YGFCGTTPEYCGTGCQSNFGSCGSGSVDTTGRCGTSFGISCTGGLCCSQARTGPNEFQFFSH